jgi:transcriptional regulator with XRE-family HTH domain
MIVVAAWTLVRCIFVNLTLRCKRPINLAYPISLNTLGDHLRKVRLDRGMSQPQVAKLLKVTPDTVTGWELNRHQPPVRLAKGIIQFLGYIPFQEEALSIGRKLYFARLLTGKTQEQVSAKIGCDESNLRYIELGKRRPQKQTMAKIQSFIASANKKFRESK